MKQVKLFIYLFIAGVIVAACNKDEAVTMRWDLTGCSNPWDSQINLDTFTTDGYHQGIYDYLMAENISVNYISSEFDSLKVELCLACFCKTGEIILVNIPKRDRRKLKRLEISNQFNLAFY
tara:strand:+ start:186 stop:548 length:363 start_codon:yes stop_codon:yes gene_type:complete